jgi:hypothetical protein
MCAKLNEIDELEHLTELACSLHVLAQICHVQVASLTAGHLCLCKKDRGAHWLGNWMEARTALTDILFVPEIDTDRKVYRKSTD